MLQLCPVYLLWNRCKTLTGSPDPTRANGTNKPCMLQLYPVYLLWNRRKTLTGSLDPMRPNSTNKPCMVKAFLVILRYIWVSGLPKALLSKGGGWGPGTHNPSRFKFFHFHAVFGKKNSKYMHFRSIWSFCDHVLREAGADLPHSVLMGTSTPGKIEQGLPSKKEPHEWRGGISCPHPPRGNMMLS